MRIQNEKSGSSSLFAQPVALEPIPETLPDAPLATNLAENVPAKAPRTVLEARMEAVLAELAKPSGAATAVERQGHLALLKRWFYRPEVRRVGEICLPDAEGHWPLRSMLRSVGRIAAKTFNAPALEQS